MSEQRIPSVEYNAETGTYKVATWFLHPIHEKLGLDEDVLKSYIETNRKEFEDEESSEKEIG